MTPTFKFNIGDNVRDKKGNVYNILGRRYTEEQYQTFIIYSVGEDECFFESELEPYTETQEPPKQEVWGLFFPCRNNALAVDYYTSKEAAEEEAKGEDYQDIDYFIKRIVLED